MNIFESIILGIIQGLTEFLPVSSSGHLVLMQKIFGVECDVLFFDTMLHVGTLVAVFAVLWKEIAAILKKPLQKMTGMLIAATIPAIVFVLLFNKYIDDAFEGKYLGYGFLLTSIVLILGEALCRVSQRKKIEVTYPKAIVMGGMQALAVLPGLSRSGSTIAGGLLTGLNRDKSANFAFLMSIPVILGSIVYQGYDIVKEGAFDSSIILPSLIGMVFAGISGYFAVRFMLKLVKKHRLYGFAIYTAILGAFVLLDQFVFKMIAW